MLQTLLTTTPSVFDFLHWPRGLGASDVLRSPWVMGGDLLAVAICAVTGVLKARRMRMDMVGASVIAVVSGLGGGTLRDILLGHGPVFWLAEPQGVATALIAGWTTYAIAGRVRVEKRDFEIPDAFGLALFAMLGTERALISGHGWLVAVLLGVTTGTFGGVLRDVLCNEIPSLFVRRELYATAAAIGSFVFVGCRAGGWPGWVSALVGAGTVLALRLGALKWRWRVPGFASTDEKKV